MPPFAATKLGIQFARFAAASGSATSASLRNAFGNATAGGPGSASSTSWAQGLSGSASSNGAGIGGAKFQAGRGAHSSFQQSGRAIANANATGSHDGANQVGDEDDELSAHQARIHRPGQLHRSGMLARRSWAQSKDVASLQVLQRQRQRTTTLPALQLILPNSPQLLITSASTVRKASTSADSDTTEAISQRDSDSQIAAISTEEKASSSAEIRAVNDEAPAPTRRNRHFRSHSVDENVGRRSQAASEHVDLLTPLHRQRNGVKIFNSAAGDNIYGLGESDETDVVEGSDTDFAKHSDDPAIISMRAAQATGDTKEVLDAINRFRKSDRSTQSLAAFDFALSCFLTSAMSHRNMEEVYSTYLQLVESGFTPTATTYSYMILALCSKDEYEQSKFAREYRRRGVHEGDEYAQARSMFSIAHSVQSGRLRRSTYVAMLKSCAIRGDVKQASFVMDKMATKGHKLLPVEMSHVIDCLNIDSRRYPLESADEVHARILQSCMQVLSESEKQRAELAEQKGDAIVDHAEQIVVWNSMLRAAFRHSDVTLALNLLEKMIDGTPLEHDYLSPPMPTSRTGDILLVGLADKGDITAAYRWIERLIELNSKDAKASESSERMPMPSTYSGIARFINMVVKRSIPLDIAENPRIEHDALQNMLPSLPTIRKLLASNVASNPADHAQLLHSSRILMLSHIDLIDAMRKLPEDHSKDIKALIDSCLEHFPVVLEHDLIDVPLKEKTVGGGRDVYLNLLNVAYGIFDKLIEFEHYTDAAVLCSYAIELSKRSGSSGAHGNMQPILRSARIDKLLAKLSTLTHLGFNDKDVQHAQAFFCTVGFCLPHLDYLKSFFFRDSIGAVAEAYLNARKLVRPSEAGMPNEGWQVLLEIFTELTANDFSMPEDAPFVFAEDILALSSDVREALDLSAFVAALKFRYPTTAYERMAKLGYEMPSESTSESQTSPSTQGASDTDATEISSETASMAMTTESLLESYVPVNGLRKDISTLPAVQVVDDDHGVYCLKLANDGGRGRYDNGRSLKQAYGVLLDAIEKDGQYPTVARLADLIVLFGRARDVDTTHHLYLIGCHVLGSLGGDPDWQKFSWQALENSMVCAMAHAGQSKAASNHRHRLIGAGSVPSADAYAALIAVIRDTTDDALIAEELFAESQRLGVVPNVYLYNTVISKMCRARKQDRAMQLFNEMLQQGLRPTSVTYGSMINGCTRTGDIASAEQIFSTMENSKNLLVKAPPFNTMIQYFTYTRPDREKALYYYDKLVQMRVSPTAFTYKLLLDIYGGIEPVDLSGLERAFGELIANRHVGVESQHWSSVITAHGAGCGDLEKAIEIFEAIPDHLSTKDAVRRAKTDTFVMRDAVAYDALLSVFNKHGRIDLMFDYLKRMSREGISVNAYIANAMIKALSKLQMIEQNGGVLPDDLRQDDGGLRDARALFDEMDDPPMGVAAAGNHPPNHRHHAATTLDGGVDGTSSDNSVADSSATPPSFRGVLREPSTFETMIKVELAYGHAHKAQEIVERMSARGYPPILINKASMLANGIDVSMTNAPHSVGATVQQQQ